MLRNTYSDRNQQIHWKKVLTGPSLQMFQRVVTKTLCVWSRKGTKLSEWNSLLCVWPHVLPRISAVYFWPRVPLCANCHSRKQRQHWELNVCLMIRFHGSCTQGSWHGGTGSSTDSLGAGQVLQIRDLAVRGTRRKRGKKLPQLIPICKTGSQEEIPVCHTCCHLVNVAHCWLSHSIFGRLNVLMFLRSNHTLAKTDIKNINLRMPFDRFSRGASLENSSHHRRDDFQSTIRVIQCPGCGWICNHCC